MGMIKMNMEAGQYSKPLSTEKQGLPGKLSAVRSAMDWIIKLHQAVIDDPDMGDTEAQDVADVYNTAVDSIQRTYLLSRFCVFPKQDFVIS